MRAIRHPALCVAPLMVAQYQSERSRVVKMDDRKSPRGDGKVSASSSDANLTGAANGISMIELDEFGGGTNVIAHRSSRYMASVSDSGGLVEDGNLLPKERKPQAFDGMVTKAAQSNVREKYTFDGGQPIGRGLDSVVRTAKNNETGVTFAIKTVKKTARMNEMLSLRAEIEILVMFGCELLGLLDLVLLMRFLKPSPNLF